MGIFDAKLTVWGGLLYTKFQNNVGQAVGAEIRVGTVYDGKVVSVKAGEEEFEPSTVVPGSAEAAREQTIDLVSTLIFTFEMETSQQL